MPQEAPLVRMAELEIDPAQVSAYRAALVREIEASLALEPGVLALQAMAEPGQPHRIRLLEVYADESAYAAHLRTPHFLAYKAETAGAVISLSLSSAEPVRLLSKSLDF